MPTFTWSTYQCCDSYVADTNGTPTNTSNALDDSESTYCEFDVDAGAPSATTGHIWWKGLSGVLPAGAYCVNVDGRAKTDTELSSGMIEYLYIGYVLSGTTFTSKSTNSWNPPGSGPVTYREISSFAVEEPHNFDETTVAMRNSYRSTSSFPRWLRVYVTDMRMYYVEAEADKEITSTPWLYPTNGYSESYGGGGTAVWSDPDNIVSDDSTNATTSSVEDTTQALMGDDWGISLPASATPLWIEYEFDVASGGADINPLYKLNGGSVSAYTGGAFLYDNSITKSDLENSNFRFGLFNNAEDDPTSVDMIRIKIWYEADIATAGSAALLIGP